MRVWRNRVVDADGSERNRPLSEFLGGYSGGNAAVMDQSPDWDIAAGASLTLTPTANLLALKEIQIGWCPAGANPL
jgi:hypothetical protein